MTGRYDDATRGHPRAGAGHEGLAQIGYHLGITHARRDRATLGGCTRGDHGDHPRAPGPDVMVSGMWCSLVGSPTHAGAGLLLHAVTDGGVGITQARRDQTRPGVPAMISVRGHPGAPGPDSSSVRRSISAGGSPRRAGTGHPGLPAHHHADGITQARRNRTTPPAQQPRTARDHPGAPGPDSKVGGGGALGPGSPRRAGTGQFVSCGDERALLAFYLFWGALLGRWCRALCG